MLTPTERPFASYMRQMAVEEGGKRTPPNLPKTMPFGSPAAATAALNAPAQLRVIKEEAA